MVIFVLSKVESKGNGVLRNPATQHSVHPTGGSRRVFKPFVWLEVGSVKVALSRPAHPRVTHTVRQLRQKFRINEKR